MDSSSARMCGCKVLNADERSANRSVALGCSRCLCTVSTMSVLASSAPLPAWYTNWRGSINGSVTVIMCLHGERGESHRPEVIHGFN